MIIIIYLIYKIIYKMNEDVIVRKIKLSNGIYS